MNRSPSGSRCRSALRPSGSLMRSRRITAYPRCQLLDRVPPLSGIALAADYRDDFAAFDRKAHGGALRLRMPRCRQQGRRHGRLRRRLAERYACGLGDLLEQLQPLPKLRLIGPCLQNLVLKPPQAASTESHGPSQTFLTDRPPHWAFYAFCATADGSTRWTHPPHRFGRLAETGPTWRATRRPSRPCRPTPWNPRM